MQAIWQRNFSEMLQQLALFPSGRDVMQREPTVLKALQQVKEQGLTVEARRHAEGALAALNDREMHVSDNSKPKHIMLSYQVRPSLNPFRYLVSVQAHHLVYSTVELATNDTTNTQLTTQPQVPRVD